MKEIVILDKDMGPAMNAKLDECFCGSVTVGDRGQIVIPAEVRKLLGINAGDRLLVFRHPRNFGLMLSRLATVREMTEELRESLEALVAKADRLETSESEEDQ